MSVLSLLKPTTEVSALSLALLAAFTLSAFPTVDRGEVHGGCCRSAGTAAETGLAVWVTLYILSVCLPVWQPYASLCVRESEFVNYLLLTLISFYQLGCEYSLPASPFPGHLYAEYMV